MWYTLSLPNIQSECLLCLLKAQFPKFLYRELINLKALTKKTSVQKDTKVPSSSSQKLNIQQWLTEGVIFSHQPGKVLIAWGESHWHASPKEKGSSCYYFPDFFLREKEPWLHFQHSVVMEINDLIAQLTALSLPEPAKIIWGNPSKEMFKKGFHELQLLLRNRKLEKIVHYVISNSSGRLTPSHRKRSLLSILKSAQENPIFAYGYWKGSEGMLGATPELLFRLEEDSGTILETMALAGTQKTDAMSYKMLSDEKLLQEHDIVVDEIALRLSHYGRVHIGKLQILSLPMLSHLYTPISALLHKKEKFSALVNLLHPTPSLGGRPRDSALNWLSEYNQLLPRGRYGAPIGYWDAISNEHVCYVAIRNVIWDENTLKMCAGCGIIPDSDMEMEWQEALLKTKSIIRLLNL